MALGKATDKTALLGSDEDAGEMGGIRQDTLTWKTKIIYGTFNGMEARKKKWCSGANGSCRGHDRGH